MKPRQDAAYVLGVTELGEADLIVTLLAEHAGRVRGVAASARKSRRRFGGALEPLSWVDATWREREGRELHRVEALELRRSFADMQSEPAVQAACAVLAEVAGGLARENEGDPREFRLLGAVLEALESGLDPLVGVRYFEYWTSRLHGILPELRTCRECGRSASPAYWTDHLADGVTCGRCAKEDIAGGNRIDGGAEAFLHAAAEHRPEEMAGHEAAARAGGVLEGILRGAIEDFAERRFATYRHLRAATRNGGAGR